VQPHLREGFVVLREPSSLRVRMVAKSKRNPCNGWSLFGLAESLKRQGKSGSAARVLAKFDRAWEHADVQLDLEWS
jgi:hypothetical protein